MNQKTVELFKSWFGFCQNNVQTYVKEQAGIPSEGGVGLNCFGRLAYWSIVCVSAVGLAGAVGYFSIMTAIAFKFMDTSLIIKINPAIHYKK